MATKCAFAFAGKQRSGLLTGQAAFKYQRD